MLRVDTLKFISQYKDIIFKKYLFFILLTASYIPAVLLYKVQFTDSFHFLTLSLVSKILDSNDSSLLDYQIDFPGDEILFVIMKIVTNFSLIDLKSLPIGSILVPLSYFILSKKLLKNTSLAFLVSLYTLIDPLIILGSYDTFTYAFTGPLYLLFLFTYYRYMFEKKSTSDFLILLIIFSFLDITHPTYAIWCIFFSIAHQISIILFPLSTSSENQKINQLYTTSLILCIIFLSFNEFIYSQILPKMFGSDIYSTVDLFLSQINSILFSHTSTTKYSMINTTSPVWDYARALRVIVILIPIFIFSLSRLIKLLKRTLYSSGTLIFIFSNLLTGIFAATSYAAYGHISLKYVVFIFPIVATMCILSTGKTITTKKLTLNKIHFATIFLIFLLTLSTISIFHAFHSPLIKSTASFKDMKPGSIWAINNINEGSSILTDLSTQYAFYMVDFDGYFKYSGYDSHVYDSLVNPNSENKLSSDYVIINHKLKDSPTVAIEWKYYEPLINYYDNLHRNNNINLIYDDSSIHVFYHQFR